MNSEMNVDNLDSTVRRLRSVSERLLAAKESLEVDGQCPEVDATHGEDPYNVGYIYASICNSLHQATDAINGIMDCVEDGGLKEVLEETELAKHTENEQRTE